MNCKGLLAMEQMTGFSSVSISCLNSVRIKCFPSQITNLVQLSAPKSAVKQGKEEQKFGCQISSLVL